MNTNTIGGGDVNNTNRSSDCDVKNTNMNGDDDVKTGNKSGGIGVKNLNKSCGLNSTSGGGDGGSCGDDGGETPKEESHKCEAPDGHGRLIGMNSCIKDPEVGIRDIPVRYRKDRRRWTTLEKYLVLTSVLLALACLTFIVVTFTRNLNTVMSCQTSIQVCLVRPQYRNVLSDLNTGMSCQTSIQVCLVRPQYRYVLSDLNTGMSCQTSIQV